MIDFLYKQGYLRILISLYALDIAGILIWKAVGA